ALTMLIKCEGLNEEVEWNQTAAELPRCSIPHLFELQVERTPDRTAIQSGNSYISYSELNRRANQFGRYLIGRGVRTEEIVGVFMDRCLEMVVSLLAILKTGAAYLPLDPTYPKERIGFMMADARIQAVLTTYGLERDLADTDAEVICVDRRW